MSNVKMICAKCGGENVLADAFAKWDRATQQWTIESVFDKGHVCNDCDDECKIEEQEIEQ